MSELPDTFDLEQCARYLRGLAASDSPILPIGEAALALASFSARASRWRGTASTST